MDKYNNQINIDLSGNISIGLNEKETNNISLYNKSQINNILQNFLNIKNNGKSIDEENHNNNMEKTTKYSKNLDSMNITCMHTSEEKEMKDKNNQKMENKILETSNDSGNIDIKEEDLNYIKEEVEIIKDKLDNFHKNEILYKEIKELANSRIEILKNKRRFDKIWLHLEMDNFFSSIEIRDNPSLKDIPIAIGNISIISSTNIIARNLGIKKSMPGLTAIKSCPELKIIEPNFSKYKEESIKIMDLLEEYDIYFEPMGLDEAYLDLTDYCKNKKIYSKEEIIDVVKEIKNKIYQKVKLACSCGIACNKNLAKICSDYNKPNGIFYLDYEPKTIEEFVSKLSIKKIPFIGNKIVTKLNLLNIFTCKDLMDIYIDLFYLNENSFDFYMKNCLGIGRYEHSEYQEEKSISRSETFILTEDRKFLFKTLGKLNEKIFRDMDRNKILYCKTLTIEVIGLTERKSSKCITNNYGLPNRNFIIRKAYELLDELLEREEKVRMIRFKISGLVKCKENKNIIFNLLNNLKDDYKNGILPKNKLFHQFKLNTIFRNIKENNEKYNITKRRNSKKENNKKAKSKLNKKRYRGNKINKNKKYKDIINLLINMKKNIIKVNDKIINKNEFI